MSDFLGHVLINGKSACCLEPGDFRSPAPRLLLEVSGLSFARAFRVPCLFTCSVQGDEDFGRLVRLFPEDEVVARDGEPYCYQDYLS